MIQTLNLRSRTRILGSTVSSEKGYPRLNNICVHCLRRRIIPYIYGREESTYISALKLMLKKKEKDETTVFNVNNLKKSQGTKRVFNKHLGLLNISGRQSNTKTQKQNNTTTIEGYPGMTFKTLRKYECIYESTRSYDPNLVFPTMDVGKLNQSVENLNSENQTSVLIPQVNKKTNSTFSLNALTKEPNSPKDFPQCKPSGFSRSSPLKLFNNPSARFQKSSRFNKNLCNIKSDAFKILSLSEVDIFPVPKSVQNDITKRSAETLRKLTTPGLTAPKNNMLKPDHQSVHDTTISSTTGEDAETLYQEFKDEFIGKREKLWNSKYLKTSDKILYNILESQIDVFINSNQQEEAFIMLSSFRNKLVWKSFIKHFNIVGIYNDVLLSYSEKGDWRTVMKVFKWLELDHVKPNIETYAALLNCLGRVGEKYFHQENIWVVEVTKILSKINNEGLALNNIFTETNLRKHQNENILRTIQKVLPYFEIAPIRINLNCTCSLTKNLFSEDNDFQPQLGYNIVSDTIEKSVEEQLLVEKNFSLKVKSVARKSNDVPPKKIKEFEDINERWEKMIHKGFVESIKTAKLEHFERQKKFSLYAYLICLPVETYVDILMQTVKSLVEFTGEYSPSTQVLYKVLGSKIYQCYILKKKIDTGVFEATENLFKRYSSWYCEPTGPARNTRQQWEMVIHDCGYDKQLDVKEVPWPEVVRTALGKYLFDVIFKEVKISLDRSSDGNLIPAFYQVLRFKKSKVSEEVKCHPVVTKYFKNVGYQYINFDANQVPMLCPPKPWKTPKHGGYLILPTEYVRKPKESDCGVTYLKKIPAEQMHPVFDSLNALQSVPWVVNKDVLDVILEVFQNGGCDSLSVPSFPEYGPVPLNINSNSSLKERREEYMRRMNIIRQRNNQYGLWAEALYRLSLANHFRDRIFWLPQNLDFRGRVYPVPPHLNHLGSDLFRSLLLFAKRKPLGPKGLDWIKIHITNLTGEHKKKSIQQRLDYANEILPEILDSAEKPLTGRRWWTKSEEPWQTLAACMEVKKALESPNPESYMCNFPVHQDGSCNGLQHYAALGRDVKGAGSVNLDPSSEPQDVYSVVTEIIERERSKDAAKGVEIAKVLEGFIRRKVIKQTIMTTVYGVTNFGARLQISKQLEDIENFPKERVWEASRYLTIKTFESLQETFTSAKEIQDWFIQCSVEISKLGSTVEWISPLGLPIKQPYNRKLKKDVELLVPNLVKQKNAFPPNFIHSLDSTHMMLTALYCEQAGLTFASIHDCYWTHPCTVDIMNKICRKQFISLYSQPILENLSQSFLERYVTNNDRSKKSLPNKKIDTERLTKVFSNIPKRGDFDIGRIIDSKYFFC